MPHAAQMVTEYQVGMQIHPRIVSPGEAGMADTETITVPRPPPDGVVFAAVDAGGAICWILVPKDLAQDGDLLAQMVPLLAEGQRNLYERRKSA